MGFAWPLVLLALALLPLLIAGYVVAGRRRRRRAVPYSSIALIRSARPPASSWRRHLPFALVMAALVVLTLAGARPQARIDVPISSSAVIVALDVSGSMCATDVDPNRLSAAQDAVRDFVEAQGEDTRIGLVVFSGSAQIAVPPSTQRKDLLAAIGSLTTGRGTTIGAAILKSMEAIAQINPQVQPPDPGQAGGRGVPGSGDLPDGVPTPDSGGSATARADGSHAPEIVVLLTDGANTSGVTPQAAAELAAGQGVRIYPIGFGTTEPTTLVCTADQLGGDRFNRFRFGSGGFVQGLGRRNFLIADEGTLREVAETTGGQYFAASDARGLQQVLTDLPRQVEVQQRDVEVSVALVVLAILLVLGAVWAAVRWTAFP